jgi:small-conductance mechanosensitive channel
MRALSPLPLLVASVAFGQAPGPAGSPVTLEGRTVMTIRAPFGPLDAASRARMLSERIDRLAKDPRRPALQIEATAVDSSCLITDRKSNLLSSVGVEDARMAQVPVMALCQANARLISTAIQEYRDQHSLGAYARSGASAALAWLAFLAAVWILYRVLIWTQSKIRKWRETVHARGAKPGVVRALWDRAIALLVALIKVIAALIVLIQLSFLLSYTFGLFPATAGISTSLFDVLTTTLTTILRGITGYLPNLAFLAIIVVITYYFLRIMRVFFRGLQQEDIHISGFYPDWAEPTYNLFRFLVIAFALVVAFPYLPGSKSGALQGVSIFFGVLLSFGSTSAVSNAVAGVILIYMRPFRLGDYIKIGDAEGNVTERTILVTRIRTIKNVDVTLPNATVLGAQIVNYSTESQSRRLILHTSVTIGYDAPWRSVHELLIEAAKATSGVLAEPAPFVWQTSLNDSNVSYEINAYTDCPSDMLAIYAELHKNMQEKFNAGGIEILSPAYYAVRDGNTITIPEAQRPPAYQAPSFRVQKTG